MTVEELIDGDWAHLSRHGARHEKLQAIARYAVKLLRDIQKYGVHTSVEENQIRLEKELDRFLESGTVPSDDAAPESGR